MQVYVMRSWGVAAVVVPTLIGIGWGALSLAPPDFTVARGCLLLSCAALLAIAAWTVISLPRPKWLRLSLTVLIALLILSLALTAIQWLAHREAILLGAPQRAARTQLRLVLSQFLLEGTQHRQTFIELLDKLGTGEATSDAFARELRAIEAWDTRLVQFVRTNSRLSDRTLWLQARLPMDSYAPGGFGSDPDVMRAWGTLYSNIMKIEQLLREFPELWVVGQFESY